MLYRVYRGSIGVYTGSYWIHDRDPLDFLGQEIPHSYVKRNFCLPRVMWAKNCCRNVPELVFIIAITVIKIKIKEILAP